MSNRFEEKLGEIVGELRALSPSLQRMDKRLDDARDRTIRSAAEIESLRREDAAFQRSFGETKNRLYARLDEIEDKVGMSDDSELITALSSRLSSVESEQERRGKRIWDLMKIVLAGIAGALATAAMQGAIK